MPGVGITISRLQYANVGVFSAYGLSSYANGESEHWRRAPISWPNSIVAILAFGECRPSGFFIAEDISLRSLPVWQVVAALLPGGYRPISFNIKEMSCLLNCFCNGKPG